MERTFNKSQAKSALNEVLTHNPNHISFTSRALVEMRNRDLKTGDVLNVLRGCKVPYDPEFENGCWRCQVKTKKMTVEVAFRNQHSLAVIKTWRN